MSEAGSGGETARAFLKLGLISFGGPVAHLANFRSEFVGARQWLSDEDFSELTALCQLLPGPTSSQVAFGLGLRRAGLIGAIAAAGAFLLPSAAAMILLAYGLASPGDFASGGARHGLRLAAVAVVARAVWSMGSTLCPDGPRRLLALGSAAVLLAGPGPAAQLGLIVVGGLLGARLWRPADAPVPVARQPLSGRHGWAAAALGTYLVLLFLLPLMARLTGDRSWQRVDGFYRAGAMVFGGGHVVLPLLRAEMVRPGGVSDGVFLSGYGAVQAMPGPLFSFAGFLGCALEPGPAAWAWGVLALAAIFLPGFLLVGGALPFWSLLRSWRPLRGAVAGANAAVVGILLAALIRPLAGENLHSVADVAAVLSGIALLCVPRFPPWALVLLLAAAGRWLPP